MTRASEGREAGIPADREFYESLVEGLPDAVIVRCGEDIVFVNEAAVRQMGADSAADLIGTRAIDWIHPDDREIVLQDRKEIGRSDACKPSDLRIVRLDGSLYYGSIAPTAVTWEGRPAVLEISRDVSERREREEALRRSEERFIDAIENIPDGFALYDADDRLVLCNERYREVYPKHADVLVPGSRFEDMLRAGVARGEFAAAIGREEEWIAERLRTHADPPGPIEQELSDGRWLRTEERRTREGGVVGLRTDITALKRAQQKAAEARSRLMDAIESIPDAFALFDADDRLVLFNQNYREFYASYADAIRIGATLEEMLRVGLERRAFPEAVGREEEWLAERLDQHQRPDRLVEQRLSSGRRIRISERKTSQGGIVGVRTDITELMVRQQALAEAQRVAHIGHWRLDLKTGEVTECSDEMYRIYSVDKSTFRPTLDAFLGLIHKQDRQRSIDNRNAALAEKRPYRFEYRIVRPSGEVRTLAGEALPELDENDEVVAVFGVTQDVTEARERESQLLQAQKMESVGQLTGGVAHDFNNLLAVVIGNLELVEQRLGSDQLLRELIRIAIEAAERGGELTHRLLAFSRMQTLQPRPINLNGHIDGMASLLRRTLGGTIEIETMLADDLWATLADPAQLESAILNLALNARDAMPAGGKLSIETSNVVLDDDYVAAPSEMAAGKYVRLMVTDTGTGMPPEVLQRVFEPFYTTKEVGAGSGLGLSMVFGFAKQSGGHVSIYSEEGHGASVKLYLPSTIEHTERQPAKAPAKAPRGQGEVILVVEDDREVRASTATLLRGLGYQVLEAKDGPSALSLLRDAGPVDLLFTDMVLSGGMTGPEIAKTAALIDPSIKVLYMSGYAENAILRKGRLDDGIDLVQKPFRKVQLATRIRNRLDAEAT